MKSAYELAMERLQKDSPGGGPLTNGQKTQIAEIQNKCQSKIAEKKILAEQQIKQSQGDYQSIETIRSELRKEIERLESECERQKEEVRKQKP